MSRTSLRSRSPRAFACGALVALAWNLGGCKDEPGPQKLFEEAGTWEVVQYNLEGGSLADVNTTNRAAAFLINFDAVNKVVQTASCGEDVDANPDNSGCRLAPSSTSWHCRCFGYAFEEEHMLWQEFDAGKTPPIVSFDPPTPMPPVGGGGGATDTDTDTDTDGGSATGGGGTGGAATGGAATGGAGTGAATDGPSTGLIGDEVLLTEFPTIANTFLFTPLPKDIFGSDGTTSRYMMQQKATKVFDQVLDDPQERISCEPCVVPMLEE